MADKLTTHEDWDERYQYAGEFSDEELEESRELDEDCAPFWAVYLHLRD